LLDSDEDLLLLSKQRKATQWLNCTGLNEKPMPNTKNKPCALTELKQGRIGTALEKEPNRKATIELDHPTRFVVEPRPVRVSAYW